MPWKRFTQASWGRLPTCGRLLIGLSEPRVTIACIGAGPASLSCAAELRRHGHAVTVFEKRPLAGGLNTYGVAEYKLRPSDSLREVEMIRAHGRRIPAGGNRSRPRWTVLENEFDFIFIGAGLGAMDRLGIPGEDLPHVIDALRFIAAYKTRRDFQVGRCVAVIGGGNTAIDAANAALAPGRGKRLTCSTGAPKAKCRPSRSNTSTRNWKACNSIGWRNRSRSSPRAVRFIRTQLAQPDPAGRRKAEPVPGSEFEFPATW